MKMNSGKLISCFVLAVIVLTSLSVPFMSSAEGTYKFVESFEDVALPKAIACNPTDRQKTYGMTDNPPMIQSVNDGRKMVMMKNDTMVQSTITYEFKEGFQYFEYVGYGGGRWSGMYGKSGLFKIQWSDSLNGTYRDFQPIVVQPNKGKTTELKICQMTLDRPEQADAGLAYFYCNKIPPAAKYLRLWFKASAEEGDSWYANWMCGQIRLEVGANGSDPNPPVTSATKTKPPTKPSDNKPGVTNPPTKTNETKNTKPGETTDPNATTAVNGEVTDVPAGENSMTSETAATTAVPQAPIVSTNDKFIINDSWKTIDVPEGTPVDELAKALTIKNGYEIKLFDSSSNQISKASTKLEKGMLMRLYNKEDGKVDYTYTINITPKKTAGFPVWGIVLIVVAVVLVGAGVAVLIIFRDKIFKKRLMS